MKHEQLMSILERMIEEIDLALIKAKAQIEYVDEESRLMAIGFFEDSISGDLLRDG